ncbi:hypothetical protein T484DRAFT_1869969, partial [Baffinella frigidus]
NVSKNNLGANGANALVRIVKEDRCDMEDFRAGYNALGDVGISSIAFWLAKKPGLKVVQLCMNKIKEEGAGALVPIP